LKSFKLNLNDIFTYNNRTFDNFEADVVKFKEIIDTYLNKFYNGDHEKISNYLIYS